MQYIDHIRLLPNTNFHPGDLDSTDQYARKRDDLRLSILKICVVYVSGTEKHTNAPDN
jgi:hypothetical protein